MFCYLTFATIAKIQWRVIGEGICGDGIYWGSSDWIMHPESYSETDVGIKLKADGKNNLGWCQKECQKRSACTAISINVVDWCYLWKGKTCTTSPYTNPYVSYSIDPAGKYFYKTMCSNGIILIFIFLLVIIT